MPWCDQKKVEGRDKEAASIQVAAECFGEKNIMAGDVGRNWKAVEVEEGAVKMGRPAAVPV